LEILKWIIIPVLLILMMVFRPTGLIAFTEFDIEELLQPKDVAPGPAELEPGKGVEHAAASR
jgi:branched-chain amino acid transport system permease protein